MNNSIKSNFYKTNQTVKSFCKSAGVPSENEEIWARSLGIWNTFCYPNRFKTFLFKYYSNILGTGNRVAHFNQNSDPACVFCVKTHNFPAPLETFAHLFFDCPETEKVLKNFFRKYFNGEITREKFFNGNFDGTKRDCFAINLILDTLRFSIWQCKLLKNRIAFYTIEVETISLLENITSSSEKIKQSIMQCQFINVDGERGQRERHPP